ncbi:XdhC family protein [Nocardia aurantia]|uniref:Xanthine dehydrogenase n=1 Tax=Nocardia aurantia TaxID=2585199 RepID=A0A7K0DSH4_9NOCA|nr:XdhC/CoxI family protein [Nocardia aurantia]MQY28709.1 hypothetical protein [Nocardia aurantia]
MRDVLPVLAARLAAGQPTALATVVGTFRSAPRPVGSVMLVGPDTGPDTGPDIGPGPDTVVGSVSGGCVEGALYEEVRAVLGGAEPGFVRYGVAADDAFAAGLTCGGEITVFVSTVDPESFPDWRLFTADIAADRPTVLATVLRHPDPGLVGRRLLFSHSESAVRDDLTGSDSPVTYEAVSALRRNAEVLPDAPAKPAVAEPIATKHHQAPALLGNGPVPSPAKMVTPLCSGQSPSLREVVAFGASDLPAAVRQDAWALLGAEHTRTFGYGPGGECGGTEVQVLFQAFAPKPRLILLGVNDFAVSLTEIGASLGYRVTVCDARAIFTTPQRFPSADRTVVDWPHRYLAAEAAVGRLGSRDAVVILTHDLKFDVPALCCALRLDLGYIGAMGSRRTHDDRTRRLLEAGLTTTELSRLRSPIGLDLGARTPQQTAISILAEIIADRHGGTGAHLSDLDGDIHHTTGRPAADPAPDELMPRVG